MSYTHTVTVPLSWEDAVQRTREALGEQGFGILTEIDVRATFESKLGIDAGDAVGDYVILGACNPALASRALAAEPELGALLPCNVVVRRGQERTRNHRRSHRSTNHGPAQRQSGRPGGRGRRRCPPPQSPRRARPCKGNLRLSGERGAINLGSGRCARPAATPWGAAQRCANAGTAPSPRNYSLVRLVSAALKPVYSRDRCCVCIW